MSHVLHTRCNMYIIKLQKNVAKYDITKHLYKKSGKLVEIFDLWLLVTLIPIPKTSWIFLRHNTPIQYDARCYFNMSSKADISQLNLPHRTRN